MYKLIAGLFLIGVLMLMAGFLGRIGTNGLMDVGPNAASVLALLTIFSAILLSHSSFDELFPSIETFVGGIPFLNEIGDYGSLHNVITQAPLEAAMSFMDVVLLAVIVNVISLLPLASGEAMGKNGKMRFLVAVFTGVVVAFVALFLLNHVIKPTSTYQWIASIIGSIISLISLGTLPAVLISLFRTNASKGLTGAVAVCMVFAKTKVAGIFRDAFLKALVFVFGLWLIEEKAGSLAAGVSNFVLIVTAFAPVLIMIIGLVILLRSVRVF